MRRSSYTRVGAAAVLFLSMSLPAFAKTSRTFKLSEPASVAGVRLMPGRYRVTWESHSPEATVTFRMDKKVIATVGGRWFDRTVKYARNMVVSTTDENRPRRIVEIRFAGEKRVLLFGLTGPGPGPAPLAGPSFAPISIAGVANASVNNGGSIQFVGKPRAVQHTSLSMDPNQDDPWLILQPRRTVGPQRK